MQVQDLSGNWHKWNLTKHTVDGLESRPRSELHLNIRAFLKQQFSTCQILEEIPLPGTRLILDFFVPLKKLAIEGHGLQHYQFVPFFHGTKLNFLESKKRDKDKLEWLSMNNIQLLIFNHDETQEDWMKKI